MPFGYDWSPNGTHAPALRRRFGLNASPPIAPRTQAADVATTAGLQCAAGRNDRENR